MKTGIFSEISEMGKLGILLIIVIVSLIIFGFLGAIVGVIITGLPFNEIMGSDYSNPAVIQNLKILQIFQATGIFIVPPIVASFLFKKSDYLKFKPTSITKIFISGLLMILALPIINWLAVINQSLILPEFLSGIESWMRAQELTAGKITEHFLKADTLSVLLLNLFMMALLPALGEEMLFRGVLQKIFSNMSKNAHLGIWITAFVFSAIHMQFFTFLPRFFMGAMFGYMLVWSGSLWLPITAHFVNNGTAVIVHYFVEKGDINADIETVGQENISYLVMSVFFVSSGIYYLYSKSKKTDLLNQV